jgi:hypothetical protein
MKKAVKYAARTATGMLPAALFVRLGLPALGALVFLAVLVLGVICWIISNGDRSDRVTRIILARQGDARCLASGSSASSASASQGQQSPRRRSAVRSGLDTNGQ